MQANGAKRLRQHLPHAKAWPGWEPTLQAAYEQAIQNQPARGRQTPAAFGRPPGVAPSQSGSLAEGPPSRTWGRWGCSLCGESSAKGTMVAAWTSWRKPGEWLRGCHLLRCLLRGARALPRDPAHFPAEHRRSRAPRVDEGWATATAAAE